MGAAGGPTSPSADDRLEPDRGVSVGEALAKSLEHRLHPAGRPSSPSSGGTHRPGDRVPTRRPSTRGISDTGPPGRRPCATGPRAPSSPFNASTSASMTGTHHDSSARIKTAFAPPRVQQGCRAWHLVRGNQGGGWRPDRPGRESIRIAQGGDQGLERLGDPGPAQRDGRLSPDSRVSDRPAGTPARRPPRESPRSPQLRAACRRTQRGAIVKGCRGWPGAPARRSMASSAQRACRRPVSGCSVCSRVDQERDRGRLPPRRGLAGTPVGPIAPGGRGPRSGSRDRSLGTGTGLGSIAARCRAADRPGRLRAPTAGGTASVHEPEARSPGNGRQGDGPKVGASPLRDQLGPTGDRERTAGLADLPSNDRLSGLIAGEDIAPVTVRAVRLRDCRRPGPLPRRPLLPSPAGRGREPPGTGRDSRSDHRRCDGSARLASARRHPRSRT